jgi:hypothetical protein
LYEEDRKNEEITGLIVMFDYDFKRTADSIIRANGLTHGAPIALLHFYDSNDVIHNLQGSADTDADAKTTSLAFFYINNRFFTH